MAEKSSQSSGSQSKNSQSKSSRSNRSQSRSSQSRSSQSNRSQSKNGRQKPADLARTAVQTLTELTGRRPETVLGLRQDEDGWRVTVEVLEMSRIPNSTDVLGCYVVRLDEDGEVVGYERRRRYQRGQAGEEGE